VPDYITTTAALATFLAEARFARVVGIDTEGASFHRYRDRVYLLQLSTGSRTAVVDPLVVTDLAPLGQFLADPDVEKVFHDADYDLRTLDRDYSFRARRVFDTRIAAQLAGEPAIGLAALLERHLGVTIPKVHQKADWSQRPLPDSMLTYAADDVRHLPTLRGTLAQRLETLARLPWAHEEFARLETLRWTGSAGDDAAFRRAKGAPRLAPRQLATLRELWRWREAAAAREDKAVFRIIGNDALVAVAAAMPRAPSDLPAVRELPAALARRHGAALLAAVARAASLPDDALPQRERIPRHPRDPRFDERVQRLKAARNAVADQLQLDPGVLLGRSAIEALARAQPTEPGQLETIPEMRRWQVDVLGPALLGALA